MALPTITDVRQYLTQIKDASAELTALTAALPRAIDSVHKAIGQLLAVPDFAFTATPPADSIKYFDQAYSYIYLPPLQGVITLVEYESSFNVWTVIDASTYVMRDGKLWFNADGNSYRYLRITAPWGYGDCPSSIAEVMIEVCVNIWRSKDTGGMVQQVGENSGGYLKTVASLTKQQYQVLQAWTDQKRVIVG